MLRDETFPGRVGWKAIVVRPGDGHRGALERPFQRPDRRAARLSEGRAQSPLDQRTATFAVAPGGGTVTAPRGRRRLAATTTHDRSGDGFAGVFADAAAGKGVLLLLLLVAFGWGALHALSPGHGKAMVAAYLIGTRGTARHARRRWARSSRSPTRSACSRSAS